MNTQTKNVFISYGRAESKHFAARLHDNLKAKGLNVWFDQNDIPLGVDFQDQIDEGIETADNFIFIIAPHALKSEYCLKEIILALKRNKRIIPILHIEPTEKEVWAKMHPAIGKINWIYMREQFDAKKEQAAFEAIDNFEAGFEGLFTLINQHKDFVRQHTEILIKALEWQHKQKSPTLLLQGEERQSAEAWLHREFKGSLPPCSASALHTAFICESKKKADGGLTDLFISYHEPQKSQVEEIRQALMRHAVTNWVDYVDIKTGVQYREAVEEGIEKADNFLFVITPESVISEECLDELAYALQLNKRIIALKMLPTPKSDIPKEIRNLQFVDFTDNEENAKQTSKNEKSDFEQDIDDLLALFTTEKDYFRQHSLLLSEAKHWEKEHRNPTFLLPDYKISRLGDWLRKAKLRRKYQSVEIQQVYFDASVAKAAQIRQEKHDNWLQKAQTWEEGEKADEFLLQTEKECNAAEFWIEQADKTPLVTPVPIQREFIKLSREKHPSTGLRDIFISYGRAESKFFATKLHDNLREQGYDVWFDQNDIPLGVDFQDQIDEGIEKAKNFIFVISPHSLKSIYCLKEIVLALKRNKRIIPILHVEPTQKEVWDKMHPAIGKINWVYMREGFSFDIAQENYPSLDDFEPAFEGLVNLIESHQEYVFNHTQILDKALSWERNQQAKTHLLSGYAQEEAETWLNTLFVETQAPCSPSELHVEFICEGKKIRQHSISDAFVCYASKEEQDMRKIRSALMRYGITTWVDRFDIKTGEDYGKSIERGIEKAKNFLFFLTPTSIKSEYCLKELDYALRINKRIITLKVLDFPDEDIPESIRKIQYVDFTDNDDEKIIASRNEKSDFDKDIDDLINQFAQDEEYFSEHTRILNEAIIWDKEANDPKLLLKGYELPMVKKWLAKGKRRSFGKPSEVHENFITQSIIANQENRLEKHNQWEEKAQKWEEAGKSNELLLKGSAATGGLDWLKDALQNSDTKPTKLQKEFFKASEEKDSVSDLKDIFISYSRRNLPFARYVHQVLVEAGFSVWFDQIDIPLGVDFQTQINDGISKAHSFLFIISPPSVQSEFCRKEIDLAVKFNKRIIPLLYDEPKTADDWAKMHPIIGKINWIYFRENQDDYKKGFDGLLDLMYTHRPYLEKHTDLLLSALNWEKEKKSPSLLLVDKEREDAFDWLQTKFPDGQPPCLPSDVHCEFVSEATKEAEGGMTDVFLSYATENGEERDHFRLLMNRQGYTVWTDKSDIKSGTKFEEAINEGIEQASVILYMISSESVISEYCLQELNYATELNKRIVPIRIGNVPDAEIPELVRNIQYIDFTSDDANVYQKSTNALLAELKQDREYFYQHKIYLSQALKWEKQGKNPSILLRNFGLEKAQAWLEIAHKYRSNLPTNLQQDFIATSDKEGKHIIPEVFISYSRSDGDFAKKLNRNLQTHGKTTWFDQENIDLASDFKEALYQGVEDSQNFLFVISPNSVTSKYCEDEVRYAHELGKRIITVYYKDTDTTTIPAVLAGIQWVDFRPSETDFHLSFGELARTLDTDREHVQQHTKWAAKAMSWQKQDKDKALLLRGIEFTVASAWLDESLEEKKTPAPTALQKEYIEESKGLLLAAERARVRRMRILQGLLVLMSFLFVGSIFLAWQAYQAKQEAVKSEKTAVVAQHQAEKEKEKADKERERAEEQKKKAVLEEQKALEAKAIADSARVIAEEQTSIAQTQRAIAFKERQQAEEARDAAKISEEKAKAATEVAKQETEKAIAAEKETIAANKKATFQLYWFNAKRFATKSILEKKDKELKAQLAMTAYQLSAFAHDQDSVPRDFSPDILEALQEAYLAYQDDNIQEGESWVMNSVNGNVAFSDENGHVLLASLKEGIGGSLPSLQAERGISMPKKNKSFIRSMAFDNSGNTIVLGTNDGAVMLATKQDSIPRMLYQHEDKNVLSTLIAPKQNWLISSSMDNEHSLTIWDLASEDSLKVMPLESPLRSLTLVNDKFLVASNTGGDLVYWDLNNLNNPLNNLYRNKYPYHAQAYNPKRNWLVAGDGQGELHLFVLNSQGNTLQSADKQIFRTKHRGTVTSVSFSNNGDLMASAGMDGTVLLWNLKKTEGNKIDKIIPTLIDNDKRKVFSVAFDKTNQYLLFGDNEKVRIRAIDINLVYDKLNQKANIPNLNQTDWDYYRRGEIKKPTK